MIKDDAIIQVKNVSFSYPQQEEKAVQNLSLAVREGEFLAVLGHNGSGKSTLAKLLNALFVPTEGRVVVSGIDTAESEREWEVHKRCGMVFQNPDNQLVATIVEEDVAFGLENLGVPSGEIRERVDASLDAVGMREFAEKAPHMLSGGQKQRIAIAGVIAMHPKVIVFDEATAMLDPAGRESVLHIVLRLCREEGITVVWITHFMEEAALADRLVVMDAGRIALEGTPREVFARAGELRAIGLDVPQVTRLAERLREKGIDLPEGILDIREMVVALCRLKSKT